MACKYYKIRKKNNKKEKRIYYYCSYQRKEINYIICKGCPYKEYKSNNNQIKKCTYKLTKAEKNRFSILYNQLDKCCICGNPSVELNEVYEGAYRQLSIEYGMVIPLCNLHHKQFHNNRLFALYYKALFQKEFEKTNSHEEFIKIFKKNYIYLYEKEKMRGG